MAIVLTRIVDETDDTMTLARVDTLYLNGYEFGERQLEDVPFAVTTDGERLVCTLAIDEALRRRLRIDKTYAEADGLRCAETTDLFALDATLRGEEEGLILRTHLPAEQQAFSCYGTIILDGEVVILPTA